MTRSRRQIAVFLSLVLQAVLMLFISETMSEPGVYVVTGVPKRLQEMKDIFGVGGYVTDLYSEGLELLRR